MSERPDLAAMLGPLVRALTALEEPVLARYGLSMWGYAVLCGLDGREVRRQATLARSIGADKTRIIGVLDDLQDAGLIDRTPDPADRRVYLLALTEEGSRVQAAAQGDIQRREDALLAHLDAGDRAAFLRALQTLAALPREDITALADDPVER